jgi:hypothetical protein
MPVSDEEGERVGMTNKAVRGGSIRLIDCQCGVEVTEGPDDVCVFLLDGGGQETDGFCFHPDDAPRVASLLLPEGTVAVERGRLERVIEYGGDRDEALGRSGTDSIRTHRYPPSNRAISIRLRSRRTGKEEKRMSEPESNRRMLLMRVRIVAVTALSSR